MGLCYCILSSRLFFKTCSDCSLREQSNCSKTDIGKKKKTSQVIWGHGFLKQVKFISYICELLSDEKWRPQPERVDCIVHVNILLKDLLHFRRGFF